MSPSLLHALDGMSAFVVSLLTLLSLLIVCKSQGSSSNEFQQCLVGESTFLVDGNPAGWLTTFCSDLISRSGILRFCSLLKLAGSEAPTCKTMRD